MVSSADILNARILVVDDKEANVRLIEGMLRVADYTCVQSTTDPNEVCELYGEFGSSIRKLRSDQQSSGTGRRSDLDVGTPRPWTRERRGRPPARMTQIKRRGRPPGSKNKPK
jgi:hypothetical protein